MNDRIENFLRLYLTPGIGPKFLRTFFNLFGPFEGDLEEKLKEFSKETQIPSDRLEKILKVAFSEETQKVINRLKTLKVKAIPFFHPEFPKELNLLGESSAAIFTLGETEGEKLTVVGTRKASAKALKKTQEFATALVSENVVVLSGGAYGVDRAAHRAALNAGGKTGVVVGEGILSFLNRERRFAEEVLSKGGFIASQFPPQLRPSKWTFPKRNSLLAALGNLGTLVVQAPLKSGALITAQKVLKLKRPLFVYLSCTDEPGFEGNVTLLEREKTHLVASPERLLTLLGKREISKPPTGKPQTEFDPVLQALKGGPKTFDELLTSTGLPEEELMEKLTLLELEGKLIQEGGFYKKI